MIGAAGRPAVSAIHDAFMHGWAFAMVTAAAVLAAAAVATVRTPRPIDTDAPAADAGFSTAELFGEVASRR